MKTSEHIKETLDYIVKDEMDGRLSPVDAYLSLLDLLEKVLDDEDMLTDNAL